MTERSRRTVLRTLGVLAAGGLAGCGQQSPSDATETPTPTTTPTATATPGATATPTATPQVNLDERARTLVSRLGAGEYQAAADQFASQAGVDAATLETVWAEAQQQLGALVSIKGTEGTTVSSYDAIVVTAQFSQALQGVRVVFDESGQVIGLQLVAAGSPPSWSPPDYVTRDAIATSSVTVNGGACDLPGEVTVPASAAGTDGSGVPSVVLLGGSGPTDLDGTLGPNKPYRDIAWGAASAGQGTSLRYTKRTATCAVEPATVTIDDEYTDDALAAIQRLRNADGADPNRTVIVGHSLGAELAPRVAARAEGIAGVVLLAPPGRTLPELLVEQTRYIAELDGTIDETEQQRIDALEAAAERIADLDIGEGEVLLGAGRPYWESLQTYDAIATARALDVPILVLHGGRDYQVTETDIQVWRDGLADQSNATFQTYPALNHLFMPGEGQSRPEEYTTLNHVAAQVITDLTEWLAARWEN